MIFDRGWLRRNVWGLLALIPVTAAMLAAHLDKGQAYEHYWTSQPRLPIAAVDGWADYSGARIRLVELAQAKDIRDTRGDTFTPPTGLAIWRAVLEFDTGDQKQLTGCQIWLEDEHGLLYDMHAVELNSARLPAPQCTAEDASLNRYQAFVFFITPGDTVPAGIRITRAEQLPRYVRFDLAR